MKNITQNHGTCYNSNRKHDKGEVRKEMSERKMKNESEDSFNKSSLIY